MTLALLASCAAGTLSAQTDHQRVERVRALGDSTQSYAIQLPPGYSTGRRSPLLILMDPRGRALIPLDCFSAAADRLGWVVMSSYDTRSDTPTDPNTPAVNAMLADATGRLAVDPARIYLAGFSGTARAAWIMAAELQGHVAGVIGFGAGLPPTSSIVPFLRRTKWDPRFAAAGGAGDLDFNYSELRALADSLGAVNIPHHLRRYAGGHGWPAERDCADALWWLETEAMKHGLAPRDDARPVEARSRFRQAADSLIARGALLEGGDRLRSSIELFDGWLEVGAERTAYETLTKSRAYRDAAAEESATLAEERHWLGVAGAAFAQVRRDGGRITSRQFLEALEVDRLQRAAADSSHVAAAQCAARRLEWLHVQAAFYEARDYLAAGKPATAVQLLEVAQAIRPLGPDACALAKQAHEALGDPAATARLRGCGAPPVH